MSEIEILALNDAKKFMDIVLKEDAKERIDALQTLDDLAICENLRYGIYNDPKSLPELSEFYTSIFLKAPTERRFEIYRYLVDIVSQIGGHTAGALTPFMLLDPDKQIASTATVDYCSLGTLLDDDPMTRPKDAIRMIDPNWAVEGLPASRGAIFGGLLTLGDKRVCKLLEPLRLTMSSEEVQVISKCYSGMTHFPVIEFYLDWLEEQVSASDHASLALFGNVAAGLFRLNNDRRVNQIFDGLRPFPVPKTEDASWKDKRFLDFEDVKKKISLRMYALEAKERPPKVMPHVLKAFELDPRAKAEDIAEI